MSKTKRRFGAMLLAFCMLVGTAAAVPVSATSTASSDAIGCGAVVGGIGFSLSAASASEEIIPMFTNVSHMGSFTVTTALGSDCDVLVSGYDANNRLTDVAVLQGVDLSAENTVVNNAGKGFAFSAEADSYKIIVLKDLGTLAPATTAATGTITKNVKETPTIYVAGDSTVCNYPDSQFPKTGWGMVLDNYLTDGAATIENRAVAATSTRSFKYDTSKDANGTELTQRYIDIRDGIEAGDFFFIQFGHNDMWQDDNHAAVRVTVDEYKDYLVEYVRLATDKGAYPMLVSSMVRNPRTRVAEQVAQLKTYADAMKEVAETYGVPFVNLHDYSTKYMKDIANARGEEWQDDLYVMLVADDARFSDDPRFAGSTHKNGEDDQVHFNYYGANIWAKQIAQGIKDNGLYIADSVDLTYVNTNPGDKFVAEKLYKVPYNGVEDFEGDSPKFSKTADNNAAVEVVANPADGEGSVNTSPNALKITPDTLLSPGGNHSAAVKPTINYDSDQLALPERYFTPLDKYTVEFDLYLASEPDNTRTWQKKIVNEETKETTYEDFTFDGALEEHHNNVNHYAVSPQNSVGTAIGGILGTSTKDANDKTAWNDDPTFRFGSRYNGSTAPVDWKATNLAKGAWNKIKLEYYPDVKDYSKTVTHFYVNGSYTGSTDVYFGNDPANPAAPMTDIIQLSFAGQQRNMLDLYVDNVSITAEKKTESTEAAVLQSLTVTGLETDATVDNETRTVTVNVPLYDESGNAPEVDLAAAEVTAAVEEGTATAYIGSTSFAADGTTKATVALEGSNILTLVNASGITTYELEIQRTLTETFDTGVISGIATGVIGTGNLSTSIVTGNEAPKYIKPTLANWGDDTGKSAADQLSIGVAPITDAKQANGNVMGAGQASGNALFVKKNNGTKTQNGSATVVIKDLPNLENATAFELEYDVAFDYTGATNATIWGTTGAGVEINGEKFRLHTSKNGEVKAAPTTDEGNYLRMNFGQPVDGNIKNTFSTANGDSNRPKAQTDSWHRIKIVASKAQDGTMPATFYCDGQYWMKIDLATKMNDNCKAEIGWPTQITIRTSDRRSARVWVDNLTVTYK